MTERNTLARDILIALVLGILLGAAINQWWTPGTWSSIGVGDSTAFLAGKASEANADAGLVAASCRFIRNATQFTGDLFIRSLRFIAVPIVLFSLIAGVASLGDVRKLGRIGGKTLLVFLTTTVLAITVGLTLSNIVKPGTYVSAETKAELLATRAAEASSKTASGQAAAEAMSWWKQMLDLVPANPFEALAKGDMLQIVTLSMLLGLGLTLIPRARATPVIEACQALTDAVTSIVMILMRIAPIAVFALIAPVIATMGMDVLKALAVYAMVVVVALALHLTLVYPTLLYLLTKPTNRITFVRFFRAMAPAQLLAFSSSSSAATLPVNLECVRHRLGVDDEVASFVLPLGATVNMDGTALYQACVAVFLSQLYGIHLTLADQLAVMTTATLVSIGAAGIPGGSIVLMIVVLQAIRVPMEGIAIILGLDRLLDMCRTVVNISGDAATSAIVASSEGKLSNPTL